MGSNAEQLSGCHRMGAGRTATAPLPGQAVNDEPRLRADHPHQDTALGRHRPCFMPSPFAGEADVKLPVSDGGDEA